VPVRLDAGQRLRRLLAVLAWLARRGRAPVSELAERFGLTPEELITDLELAACCGLPPYTPDQLMEILVDDEEVVANLGPELARPRRLSAAEGFALAAAARAIASVPGSDPDGALQRALSKLDAALGHRDGVRVDLDDPIHLAVVQDAVRSSHQLEIDYHSASQDEITTRVVDPGALVVREGHWYLDAWCHRAEGVRRFRVDRVLAARPTGVNVCHAVPDDDATDIGGERSRRGSWFVPGPGITVARMVVDEPGTWVGETVPVLEVEPGADGRQVVTLAVSSHVWFGRLLLRLGPHAVVLDPPELVGAGVEAARQVLARYRDGPEPDRTGTGPGVH
jgi:proteasome accessory factor C